MKNTGIVVAVVISVVGLSGVLYAGSCGDMEMKGNAASKVAQSSDAKTGTKDAVNVGNTICPVSGEKIDEASEATYVYEGKVYNFCCAMCIDAFKNDPAKYIKILEDQKNRDLESGKAQEKQR